MKDEFDPMLQLIRTMLPFSEINTNTIEPIARPNENISSMTLWCRYCNFCFTVITGVLLIMLLINSRFTGIEILLIVSSILSICMCCFIIYNDRSN